MNPEDAKQDVWARVAERALAEGWKLDETNALVFVASDVTVNIAMPEEELEVWLVAPERPRPVRIMFELGPPERFLRLMGTLIKLGTVMTVDNYARILHPMLREFPSSLFDSWLKPPVCRSDLNPTQIGRVESLVKALRDHGWLLAPDWQEVWDGNLASMSELVSGTKELGLGHSHLAYFPMSDFVELETLGGDLRLRFFGSSNFHAFVSMLDELGEQLSPDWQRRMISLCHEMLIDKAEGWRPFRGN